MDIPTASVAGVPDPLPEGLLVLDVREDDEWAAGHVAGSVHVPLMELGARYAELPDADQNRSQSSAYGTAASSARMPPARSSARTNPNAERARLPARSMIRTRCTDVHRTRQRVRKLRRDPRADYEAALQ